MSSQNRFLITTEVFGSVIEAHKPAWPGSGYDLGYLRRKLERVLTSRC
jgi:hypothetical protein